MQHHGFTEEELDYIINYDIRLRSARFAGRVKYCIGKDLQKDGA